MIVVKCAWCGAIVETKGDQTAEPEEVGGLCSLCSVEVRDAEETDLIIEIEDDDPQS